MATAVSSRECPRQTRLTDGPTGRGLYFNGDLEFREAGTGITRGDRFMNLFTGTSMLESKAIMSSVSKTPTMPQVSG